MIVNLCLLTVEWPLREFPKEFIDQLLGSLIALEESLSAEKISSIKETCREYQLLSRLSFMNESKMSADLIP